MTKTRNRAQRHGSSRQRTCMTVGAALIAWIAVAANVSPAAAQHPFPTAERNRIPNGFREGLRPDCDMLGSADVSRSTVAVGQPVTFTFRSAAGCPQLLHGAAMIVLLGGVTSEQLPGLRDALGVLLVHRTEDPAGWLALIQLADPDAPVRWARTSTERHAISDLWWRWPEQPPADAPRWASAAARASEALAGVPHSMRRVLVVIDGQAPADTRLARAALTEAMAGIGEAAGISIVADLSPNRWLFDPTLPATDGAVVGIVGASRVQMLSVVDSLDGPLESWQTEVRFGPTLHLVNGSISPPPAVRIPNPTAIAWRIDLSNGPPTYGGSDEVRFALVPSEPSSFATVIARHERNRLSGHLTLLQSAAFCAFPPDIGPGFCQTPTVTPTPLPTRTPRPTREPWTLRSRLWLPMAGVTQLSDAARSHSPSR